MDDLIPSIRIRKDRVRSLSRRHPWVFAGSISSVEGSPTPGDTVEVLSAEGEWLGRGAFSPSSQIRIRMWTWDRDEAVDEDFFQRSLDRAIASRQQFRSSDKTTAYREIYAEADGLPGLIVDRYNEIRVIQILSAGAERWRSEILRRLAERGDCAGIYERSDVSVRELEGLQQRTGVLWGEAPPDLIQIRENNITYEVDIAHGHKTGFYLDQRENREVFCRMLPPGTQVLDCFAYSGAFSLLGLKKGARDVISVDASKDALDLAERNLRLNNIPIQDWRPLAGDVFQILRKFRDEGRTFDVIVLDPPKFAATPAHIQRAARGYKDINLLAFKLLRGGGLLFTFSCSGGVGTELFQKIIADAALDAGKQVSIMQTLGQPEDHPIALNFPESRYLKGFVCRIRA